MRTSHQFFYSSLTVILGQLPSMLNIHLIFYHFSELSEFFRVLYKSIKNIFYAILIISLITIHEAHASSWIGISNEKLKSGDVDFNDIPVMILSVIDWLLGFIGAVSVIMIIYGAVRLGYGSVTGDKETGKKIITAAIIGFVIAVSGWFIVNFLLANF